MYYIAHPGGLQSEYGGRAHKAIVHAFSYLHSVSTETVLRERAQPSYEPSQHS